MKRILILANSASGLFDFRNELLLELMKKYEVHISLPDEQTKPELMEEGCVVHHTELDRRGINPVTDLKLLGNYSKLLKTVKPDIVLTYTIKPNIYGGLCCRINKVPYITNITGLGSAFEKQGIIKAIVIKLYRMSLKKASCIFFQNKSNMLLFEKMKIKGKKARIVAGSGVNLKRHCFEEYPSERNPITIMYAGRIMKEKGMDELLYAIEKIKPVHPDMYFQIIGSYEENYQQRIQQYVKEGMLEWIDYQKDLHKFYMNASAVIMPSYHEGMSNVILEASATGRPVLASNIPGCLEGFENNVTGIGFEAQDGNALYQALEKFYALSYDEKKGMGLSARKKMEREFDRNKVVQAYLEEISYAI